MGLSRIKGVTIEIGGDTTKLTDSLKKVDTQLSTTSRNLRDINRLLKLDPGNTTLLTQKQKALKEAIAGTKDRLAELKKVQEGSVSQEQWDALQREIIETEQKLESLEGEYRAFGTVAGQKIQAVGQKMKELGGKISSIGTSLSTKVTVPIVAAFTAAGKSASDYQENLNKIDTAFGDSADEVKAWAETATKEFGLSKVAATEAASGFGALAKGIGLNESSAADVSIALSGLSSDLSSYFNVGTDESAKALEGIFTGESEALKKFGVVMTETNLEKFAADHGKVWKEASQAEKTMIRYQFVLENTSDAQGDYSRTSDGTANSFRTFQASVQNLATTFGEKLLPIITPFVQKLTEIINKFSELSPETQELIVKIGLVAAAVGPLLVAFGKTTSGVGSVIKIFGKLSGAIPGVVSVVGGLVGSFGPLLAGGAVIAGVVAGVVLVVKNWDKIKAAAKVLGTAIKTAFNAIKTTISTAWNAVKTATSTAWTNLKTTVGNAVNNIKTGIGTAWNAIKTGTSTAWNGVKTTVGNAASVIRTGVVNAWSSLKTNTANTWNAVKTGVSTAVSNARTAAVQGFSALKTNVSSIWSSVKSGTSSVWESVRSTISSKISSARSSAVSIVSGMKSSIVSAFRAIPNAIGNPFSKLSSFASSAISRIKSIFSGARISLPHIKTPHFSVSMRKIGPVSIPSVSVSWYKKAYDNPVMFTQPTVMQTASGAKGFGDGAGAEIVMGLNKLRELVGSTGNTTINIYSQPGMSVNQLADAVQNRLAALERQKARAWA